MKDTLEQIQDCLDQYRDGALTPAIALKRIAGVIRESGHAYMFSKFLYSHRITARD